MCGASPLPYHEVIQLELWTRELGFLPSGFRSCSRLGNHQGLGFHLSAVEHAGALHVSFLRIGNLLLALGEGDVHSEAAALFHLLFLHLWDALSSEIQPFSRADNSILRFAISDCGLQALFNQSISKQPMAELCRFECRLITLRRRENVHALFVS